MTIDEKCIVALICIHIKNQHLHIGSTSNSKISFQSYTKKLVHEINTCTQTTLIHMYHSRELKPNMCSNSSDTKSKSPSMTNEQFTVSVAKCSSPDNR